MATLEDEEAQIRGLVDIIYCVGMAGMESNFSQLMTEGGHILNDLPFRIVGLHFCYNDIRLKPALSLIQMICARQTRLRFRTHFGTFTAVRPIQSNPIQSKTFVETKMETIKKCNDVCFF
jgi:hypothetical protein